MVVTGAKAAEPTGSKKLNILATVSPVACMVANVAGDAATVSLLLPPGSSPHVFALSPGDLKKVNSADLIFSNGLGLDEWLNKALRSGGPASRQIVPLGESAGRLLSEEDDQRGGHDHGDAHDDNESHSHAHAHSHSGVNPHVWLDPQRAMKMVRQIIKTLSKSDPGNRAEYEKNGEEFIERLKILDDECAAALAPWKGHALVTFHDAFPYFADRYRLRIAAVFEEFPGKEPSPKYLRRLKNTIQSEKVKVLFAEPGQSAPKLQVIARDLGVAIAVMDPMDTGALTKDLYERVTRSNVKALVTAFHDAR